MRKLSLIMLVVLLLTAVFALDASAAPQQELPDVAFVDGLVGHGQTYPLSCESRSAADLAGYWGLYVPEVEFFDTLPTSDNPEVGFVGSVYGTWGQTPPNPYGVHAAPVAALLREYGLNAESRKGMTLHELKTEIAAGRPAIVWIVGHVWQGVPIDYTANDGSTVIVAQYEHTMIAYGYDLSGIYLMDAGNAARKAYAYSIFEDSWGVLGNMAVTANGLVGEETPEPTAEPTPEETPTPTAPILEEGQYLVQEGDYIVKLATEWGIDYQVLAELNGLEYPYLIFPGDIILTGLDGELPVVEVTPEATTPEATIPEATAQPQATATAVPVVTQSSVFGHQKIGVETIYVVQDGEHLMKIARKLEMDWEILASLNGLAWPYTLMPGQELKLAENAILTGTDDPVPTPAAPTQSSESTSPQSGQTYVVQEGEYLYSLAKRFGVDWQVLAEYNGIEAPYTVQPGQVLQIP